MLPRTLISICLFIATTGNAQTGRYWFLGSEQSLHFTPQLNITNRFKTSYENIPYYKLHPYNESVTDAPFFPALYSDCNDSLCLFTVFDSILSYDRKPIGLIRPFITTYNSYTPSIILPIPQKNNQYGVIGCVTPDTFKVKGYGWRMHYSQVYYDRSADSGYIMTKKKAIFLKTETTYNDMIQNLNWAPHADSVNLWVLTLKNDSVLQAYLLDSSGISLNPVESKVKGDYDGDMRIYGGGTIRPSHDYKHIVVSGVSPKISKVYSTWLYDFDVKTGKVSNGRGIVKHSEHEGTYSKATEFSPKDSFIYISTHTDTLLYSPRLIQHNIYTGKNIQLASIQNFNPNKPWRLFSLQLAPDGKIYGNYINYGTSGDVFTYNNFNGNYLACIQYPDRPGKSCRFKKDSIYFKYGLSLGLPNNYCYPTVMDAYVNPNYTCKDTTVMRIDAKWFSQLKITWGDGDSVVYNNREWLDKPDQKHYYQKPGKYLVSLSGFMPPCNTFHSWQDSIVILKNPVSKGYSITKDTLCGRFALTLRDSTYGAYKNKIDWGNGSDSSFINSVHFKHYYYNDSNYKIIYTVSAKDTLGEKGCRLRFEENIKPYYYKNPKSDFEINAPVQCLNKNRFDFINTSPDTSAVTSFWDLGEQSLTKSTNIFGKTYSKDSIYRIKLFTQTKEGCKDTLEKQIVVLPSPKADFTWGIACSKTKTDFTFTGKKLTNSTFEWNFDNESKAYTENASYMFSNAGIKAVKLIVKADNSCNDTIVKTVEIKTQAKADFSVTDVCESDSAVFINKSVDADEYLWKFGDGTQRKSKVKEERQKYKVTQTTTFLVTLVAISGCSDSVVNPVT
ncbi:MAG: hypothetical protein IT237_08420, partial [Bacteroidia bacterium]|nr:hypothetical protein [Bacteroidia bacterium]